MKWLQKSSARQRQALALASVPPWGQDVFEMQEMLFWNLKRSNPSWIAKLLWKQMGNQKEQDEPGAKRGESRKRLRESGSQTDDDIEHVEPELSTSHRLEEMKAKLHELLAACGEIKTLKNEICGLRRELKSLQDSLDFANQDIDTLKAGLAKTLETVEENVEDIESLDEDIEALKRRNIKLEAYTRRENVRIFNVKEEVEENTEEIVRNLKVKDIRFERVHRIYPRKTRNQKPPNRPRPVIARFSHY